MAFLRFCPVDKTYAQILAEYARSSPSLSRRYSAIVVINVWFGKQFDPMEASDFKSWWAVQKATLSH
jgi:hypothetical protein